MGYGLRLTDEQWSELDQVRFSTSSADVFRNCLIILMSHSRDSVASICQRIGCSRDTVLRVRRLYRRGGVSALTPIKPPGRPGRATPEFLQAMNQAVQTNPLTLGYGFSNWSAVRLAAHLATTTGIRFGDDQLRRLLHQQGFSQQRPKHTMKDKRDEKAFHKARKQLQGLKKNAAEALIFQDEVEIHLHPVLARAWAKVGIQPRVPAPGQNQ
jgi:transposase